MSYNDKYLDEINKEAYREAGSKDFFSSQELSAEVIPNGIILPFQPPEEHADNINAGGGVLYSNGEYVANSARRIVGAKMNHGYAYEHCVQSDKKLVWFGGFHAHWGHFITEMVSRCWYFVKHQEEMQDIYVAYVRKSDSCDKPIYGNYLEFLELLECRRNRSLKSMNPPSFRK